LKVVSCVPRKTLKGCEASTCWPMASMSIMVRRP
jgi:hypothetical protein